MSAVAAALDGPAVRIGFDNSYARLPERFFERREMNPVGAPRLVRLNAALAERLGIDPDALASPAGVAVLAGNVAPAGAEPIAQAYAGHQFGGFSPQLGDGRAVLLGEVVGRDGVRRDIALKGSGPTRFSRRGDGRAALGPVLREYLVSESMAALGVPTTRALAAVETGEVVYRATTLPGAVLTRVAASHIRVGTFEYFAAQGDVEALRVLAGYALARHYPQAEAAPEQHARALLTGVVARQAALVAQWLLIGFVHGVMNTDNSSIAGETIDYGPCAFMDAYDPATVFSSIDHGGRYAYGNQPRIAHWNLTRLAEALLPLLGDTEEAGVAVAKEVLAGFAPQFEAAYQAGLRRKIGLGDEREGDRGLIERLLAGMAESGADFTLTFRGLCEQAGADAPGPQMRAMFGGGVFYDGWFAEWRARLAREPGGPAERATAMRAVNPVYIARNQLVEAALRDAVEGQDYREFDTLLEVLARPFERRDLPARFTARPGPEQGGYRTFCGT